MLVDQKMRPLARSTPLVFFRKVRLSEHLPLNGYNFIVHGIGAMWDWRFGPCGVSGEKFNRLGSISLQPGANPK